MHNSSPPPSSAIHYHPKFSTDRATPFLSSQYLQFFQLFFFTSFHPTWLQKQVWASANPRPGDIEIGERKTELETKFVAFQFFESQATQQFITKYHCCLSIMHLLQKSINHHQLRTNLPQAASFGDDDDISLLVKLQSKACFEFIGIKASIFNPYQASFAFCTFTSQFELNTAPIFNPQCIYMYF